MADLAVEQLRTPLGRPAGPNSRSGAVRRRSIGLRDAAGRLRREMRLREENRRLLRWQAEAAELNGAEPGMLRRMLSVPAAGSGAGLDHRARGRRFRRGVRPHRAARRRRRTGRRRRHGRDDAAGAGRAGDRCRPAQRPRPAGHGFQLAASRWWWSARAIRRSCGRQQRPAASCATCRSAPTSRPATGC